MLCSGLVETCRDLMPQRKGHQPLFYYYILEPHIMGVQSTILNIDNHINYYSD